MEQPKKKIKLDHLNPNLKKVSEFVIGDIFKVRSENINQISRPFRDKKYIGKLFQVCGYKEDWNYYDWDGSWCNWNDLYYSAKEVNLIDGQYKSKEPVLSPITGFMMTPMVEFVELRDFGQMLEMVDAPNPNRIMPEQMNKFKFVKKSIEKNDIIKENGKLYQVTDEEFSIDYHNSMFMYETKQVNSALEIIDGGEHKRFTSRYGDGAESKFEYYEVLDREKN
jgi:hypothetical protein